MNPSLSDRCWNAGLVLMLLAFHVAGLAWQSATHGPNLDELAHLAAGVSIWRTGRFDLYSVNPPLVKTVAAIPAVLSNCRTDWPPHQVGHGLRSEFEVGTDFLTQNGADTFRFLTWGRWMLIPLSVWGALTCRRWANELYGPRAGLAACWLWCTSPGLLAWGATINSDCAAAVFGVIFCRAFWIWSRDPTWRNAILSGILLGLTELTKLTWVVLLPLLPVMSLLSFRTARTWPRWCGRWLQVGLMLLLAIDVINLGYLFTGAFRPLGNFQFVSARFAGDAAHDIDRLFSGNRFRGSLWGGIPIPLPADYLLGIDLQTRDFEIGSDCYLAGVWKRGGWWYFYLVAFLLKEPLGTILAGGLRCFAPRRPERISDPSDWLYLTLPAVALVVVVSAETRSTIHLRYVLPAVPFLYLWISRLFEPMNAGEARQSFDARAETPLADLSRAVRDHAWQFTIRGLLGWTLVSTVLVFPHSHSHFNEFARWTGGGPHWLLDSNIDFGEDVLDLRRWCHDNRHARPVHVSVRTSVPMAMICRDAVTDWEAEPIQPGWYVLSVHHIYAVPQLRHFASRVPDETITPSLFVYDLRRTDVADHHGVSSSGGANSLNFPQPLPRNNTARPQ